MNDFQFLHSTFEEELSKKDTKLSVIVPTVYLVEDDQVLGLTIKKFLEKKLFVNVHYYSSPAECLNDLDQKMIKNIKQEPFCLITDLSFEMHGSDGLLLIDVLRERGLKFVSIAMTGFASIETAINATKKGVFHYLTKPFELEVLSDLVKRAFVKELAIFHDYFSEKNSAIGNDKNISGKNESDAFSVIKNKKYAIVNPTSDDIFCGMIGRSKQMQQVFERIKKVAASDSTVFISGPSGTGKELVANALHKLSHRKNHQLVSVNCGAIPSELLESELFGHEKGAFTGAISSRKGRFEVAHHGSIFLDEIGDMPLLLQVKLLRVLQNRVIERVGSSETMDVDVRIITATHRNLEEAVQEGDFREDLYYRLNVIPIKVPALCDRREDIPLLMAHFLSRFVSADGRNNIEFDDETMETLMNYEWPGNVRELENLIERLVILKAGSTIRVSDLPNKFLSQQKKHSDQFRSIIELPEHGVDLKQLLSDIEDSLITQAMELTGGNKNQASKLLMLNRTTLIEKMKKKDFKSFT